MMHLAILFRDFSLPVYDPIPDIPISGIVCDSRKVRPGDLFVVLSGLPSDGHRYIPDAVARGAAAIVGTQTLDGLSIPYVRVSDSRQALPHLAAAFYDHPARRLTVIGVTGTDGKTTTTNLIFSILKAAGIRAGMISTVNAVIGDDTLDTGFHVTTPDAPDVQRYLAQMVASGLTHAVLECTSHGLAQYRVDACNFAVAAVTNITHEHLDFHGSYEAYRAAKARLFGMLPPGGQAILNRDDSSYEYLSAISGQRSAVSYGFHATADLRPENVNFTPAGMEFTIVGRKMRLPATTRLIGDFNISNVLAATGVAHALELDGAAIQRGIASLEGVPGRMERIDLGQDFTAIVDFAHTPNALRVALETVHKMITTESAENPANKKEISVNSVRSVARTARRVIAVFGSAGLRDREKRRMMAEVSADLADLSVFTAEDPRTESLDAILAEMAAGAESRGGVDGRTFWRVPDRGNAIRFALTLACPGDIVIACGKGHEQSMCFLDVEYPWDDRIAMRAALSEHLGIAGPRMPYLPTQNP